MSKRAARMWVRENVLLVCGWVRQSVCLEGPLHCVRKFCSHVQQPRFSNINTRSSRATKTQTRFTHFVRSGKPRFASPIRRGEERPAPRVCVRRGATAEDNAEQVAYVINRPKGSRTFVPKGVRKGTTQSFSIVVPCPCSFRAAQE